MIDGNKAIAEMHGNKQVGGDHYHMVIEPAYFIRANNIPFHEGNVIKYVCRHQKKNGAEDIKKAIHYLEMILEMDYGIKNDDIQRG